MRLWYIPLNTTRNADFTCSICCSVSGAWSSWPALTPSPALRLLRLARLRQTAPPAPRLRGRRNPVEAPDAPAGDRGALPARRGHPGEHAVARCPEGADVTEHREGGLG